ncbi:hypothetical protein VK70_19370 [Paenibacillus durus ATCC 35681]|uniref:Uncharacterized protein n=1 Tax=Paenibacillus durus ATCC 35681 TaxID=1333534 RepID=A0A0F7FFN0_PAEDU|nr:hypothetical protein VK70_19370 [Paenibacillus durus ATCC 35681]
MIYHLEKPIDTQTQEVYLPPKQSANVLFNFMTKLDYLKTILKKSAMIPRYYEEDISYLNIDGLPKIAFPMKCFCDIHMNKLIPHMKFYGSYGIGIDKEWGILQGIQPLQYINKASYLAKDFSSIFSYARKLIEVGENNNYENYNDYLLSSLLFMKPISGTMYRNAKYETKNFHDEKEWRFIPDFRPVLTELPLLIPQEQLIPQTINLYSEGLSRNPDLWLKIEYDYIKYIIVENENDRDDLISFTMSDIEADNSEKLNLISKILVFDKLKEDW